MRLLNWLRSRPARPTRQKPRPRRPRPALQVECLEQRWCPSYSLVTSASALAATDYVNWGSFGPPGTLVANPSTVLSNGGLSIGVSKAVADDFQIFEQSPPTAPTSYQTHGNFTPGDLILATEDGVSKSNPITLDFGATPVAAGGAQVMSGLFGSFTAKIQAFDANGNLLASFTENGSATSAADGSAIFIGVSSSSANIDKIAISLSKAPSGVKGYLAIDQFDYRTSPLAAAPATAGGTWPAGTQQVPR